FRLQIATVQREGFLFSSSSTVTLHSCVVQVCRSIVSRLSTCLLPFLGPNSLLDRPGCPPPARQQFTAVVSFPPTRLDDCCSSVCVEGRRRRRTAIYHTAIEGHTVGQTLPRYHIGQGKNLI